MRFGLQNIWTTKSKLSYAKRQPERALFLVSEKGQRPANLNLQEFDGWLVQERFPVGRHPSSWSRCGLISRVRMRRKQLCTLDHRLFLVIEEPILTRLKAGYDRMPRRRRML